MPVDRPSWAPSAVDITRPSVARVYDYYLGGSHNFESDREFARTVLATFPQLPTVARDNRDFLRRAIAYLVEAGVDQFLDLGSGIPTAGNVHEVAQALAPLARVVYVDRDPVAVIHSRQLLEHTEGVSTIAADIRDPRRVLDLAAHAGLDLDRPVAVLAVSVLHFVADVDQPADVMARYLAALTPGSHLALSHAAGDGRSDAADVERVYDRADSPSALRMRSKAEVGSLFGDLHIVEPGVVRIPLWRPDPADTVPVVDEDYPGVAGVGRKG